MKKKIILIVFAIVMTSCVSKKEIVYFQNDEIKQDSVSNTYSTIFKPDDLLQITVSSIDADAVKPFNLTAIVSSNTSDNAISRPSQQNYLVDNEGYIDFPVLGKIKFGGLKRSDAIKMLKKKLDPDYVKNPSINISITNFTVTILGQVNNPGVFTIPNERITILEAIGLAGDATLNAKRDNVLVTREINNEKKQYRLDLRSNKIFTSPAFYLQQNDVVYIEPNKAVSQDAAFNKNSGLLISLGSIIISLVALITR